MVGKIKRVRQKLHHDAVKIETGNEKNSLGWKYELEEPRAKSIHRPTKQETPNKTNDNEVRGVKVKAFNFPSGVFAATVIPPEALIQSLGVPEVPKERVEEPTEEQPRGNQQKKQQTKKEKMKERRERWMNKISAVKLARKEQAELARRRATPVVGDMRTLADALPELRPFIRTPASTKQRCVPKRKAEPTDYGQMKPAQKRKLLEIETLRFREAVKDSAFKLNPLAAIGEHLRKRLKQEDEQS